MGHVYARALFKGNKGVHEQGSMLVDTGATYVSRELEPTREPGALLVYSTPRFSSLT